MAIAALTLCIGTPTAAQKIDADGLAMFMAKITVYEDKCGPLPPKLTKEFIDYMAAQASQTKVIAAMNQLNELLRQPGYAAAFCSVFGKDIEKLVKDW